MFIKDNTNKYKSDIFNTQNWEYDEINDAFICPNHKRLGFKRYAYRHDTYLGEIFNYLLVYLTGCSSIFFQ